MSVRRQPVAPVVVVPRSDMVLDNAAVGEDAAVGTVVGTYRLPPGAPTLASKALKSGAGLKLVGDQLQVAADLDASAPPTAVLGQVDAAGWAKDRVDAVAVTPVPWAPINTVAQGFRARTIAALGSDQNPRRWGKALDAFFAEMQGGSADVWAQIDGLIIGSFGRTVSLLDLKRNLALTDVPSVAFTPNLGFASDGSHAIPTGFNPATANGALQQNWVHMGFWQVGATGGTTAMMGSTNLRLMLNAGNPSSMFLRLNSGTTVNIGSGGSSAGPPSNDGHYVGVRDANGQKAYFDGESFMSGYETTASSAVTSEVLTICGNAPVGQYPTQVCRAYHWGGALTAAQVRKLYWALYKLFDTAYGLSAWPTIDQSFNGNSQWVNGRRCSYHNAAKPWSFSRRGRTERYETRDGEQASFDAGQPKERSELSDQGNPVLRCLSGTVAAAVSPATGKTVTLVADNGFAAPRAGDIVTLSHTPAGGWTGFISGESTANYTSDMGLATAQKRFDYVVQSGDTLAFIASALAALSNGDLGSTASGAVITCPNATGTLRLFAGAGMTTWAAYSFILPPSPIGAANNAQFGPVLGQWHSSDDQTESMSPPFAFGMDGDAFTVHAQSCRYTPVKYSTYDRLLYTHPTNLRDGQIHNVVVKFRDGAGWDTDPAPGYSLPSLRGPIYPGAGGTLKLGTGYGAIAMWLDGVKLFDYVGIATGSLNYYPVYFKRGIYRGSLHTGGDTCVAMYANVEYGTDDLSDRVANPLPVPPWFKMA